MVDVRVGAHAEKTRIVIELDQPSGYRIGQQEIPTATGTVTELVVEMEATGAFALAGRRGLVESVRIKPQGEGSVALIRLTTQTPTINDMALENPNRIIIFKYPLEEDFPDPRDLRIEIRKTVIHEIAHHFGWSDRDLERFDDNPDPFGD